MHNYSIPRINRLISRLRNIDRTSQSSYDEISGLLKEEFPPIPLFSTSLIPDDSLPFFRTRVHRKHEKYFREIDDFSYKKDPTSIQDYGRCNTPQQQVLYCSQNSATSYMESLFSTCETSEIETVSIGTWKLKKQVRAGIIAQPYANKRYDDFDYSFGGIVDKIILRDCSDIEEIVRKLLYFIYIDFSFPIGNPIHYKICAALSNFIFGDVEAIIYPSVPFMGKGFNIAFKADVVTSRKIKLINAEIIRFKRISFKKLQQIGRITQCLRIDHNNNLVEWD